MSIRTSLVILWLALLSGCEMITYDRSHAPGMDTLVGRRFVTVQDSFLVKDVCIEEYAAKHCLLLQAAGGEYFWHPPQVSYWTPRLQFRLPADHQAYLASPDSTTETYEEVQVNPAPKDQLTWVPRGSVIIITQLVSRAQGETGRCWVVYGRLADMPADTVAEIPACWYPEAAPFWFHDVTTPSRYAGFPPNGDVMNKPPLPDPALLVPASGP